MKYFGLVLAASLTPSLCFPCESRGDLNIYQIGLPLSNALVGSSPLTSRAFQLFSLYDLWFLVCLASWYFSIFSCSPALPSQHSKFPANTVQSSKLLMFCFLLLLGTSSIPLLFVPAPPLWASLVVSAEAYLVQSFLLSDWAETYFLELSQAARFEDLQSYLRLPDFWRAANLWFLRTILRFDNLLEGLHRAHWSLLYSQLHSVLQRKRSRSS